MDSVIDSRAAPANPILIVTGNYAGKTYIHDTGSTNAEVTGGAIDGYGTIHFLTGEDQKEFLPRSAVIPLQAQSSGALEFNYGFNTFKNVNKSMSVNMIGEGTGLDSFILDTSVLGGSDDLRRTIILTNVGKNASMQIQFRNRNPSQPFKVHPIHLSDEVVI